MLARLIAFSLPCIWVYNEYIIDSENCESGYIAKIFKQQTEERGRMTSIKTMDILNLTLFELFKKANEEITTKNNISSFILAFPTYLFESAYF